MTYVLQKVDFQIFLQNVSAHFLYFFCPTNVVRNQAESLYSSGGSSTNECISTLRLAYKGTKG